MAIATPHPVTAGLVEESSAAAQPRSRVLVALDGSPAAATALPVARSLAAQFGASVETLSIVREGGPAIDRSGWRPPDSPEPSPPICERVGDPVRELLRAAQEPGGELLILATHGHEVSSGAPLAAVPRAVAARSERPVLLVVPEIVTKQLVPGPIQRLLVPLDGTPTTARGLRPAMDLAARLGAAIDLLYVAPAGAAPDGEGGRLRVPMYVDQPYYEWPAWEAEMIERFGRELAGCPSEVPVSLHVASGDPAVEIPRYVNAHPTDLVVLAHRSRLEPGRARVLHAVLAASPSPVLLVWAPPAGRGAGTLLDRCGPLPRTGGMDGGVAAASTPSGGEYATRQIQLELLNEVVCCQTDHSSMDYVRYLGRAVVER